MDLRSIHDRWLEPPIEKAPKFTGTCALCSEPLYEGATVLRCNDTGALLCSDKCAKEWLLDDWLMFFRHTTA